MLYLAGQLFLGGNSTLWKWKSIDFWWKISHLYYSVFRHVYKVIECLGRIICLITFCFSPPSSPCHIVVFIIWHSYFHIRSSILCTNRFMCRFLVSSKRLQTHQGQIICSTEYVLNSIECYHTSTNSIRAFLNSPHKN